MVLVCGRWLCLGRWAGDGGLEGGVGYAPSCSDLLEEKRRSRKRRCFVVVTQRESWLAVGEKTWQGSGYGVGCESKP